jgi:nicotinamidase-related amidase
MRMKLLVIDAQALLCTPQLYAFDRFADAVTRLISAARRNGAEVIYVRHDDGADQPLSPGKPGYDVYGAFAPLAGEKVYDKCINSCFRDTGLLEYLRACGETELMLCGLQTDFCIDAAVKCGFEHGFRIIVPTGGNTTTDNALLTGEQSWRYYNEWMWPRRYADCIPTEQALRLLGE